MGYIGNKPMKFKPILLLLLLVCLLLVNTSSSADRNAVNFDGKLMPNAEIDVILLPDDKTRCAVATYVGYTGSSISIDCNWK